jgi:prepilin-type N-terminal cleavage/methylation domain-containing protein
MRTTQPSTLKSQTAPRRGFTLVETMVSVAIFSLVAAAVMGLFVMSARFFASISSQTRALKYAKSAMEGPHGLNREIRQAVAPLKPVTPGADGWFNAVEFTHFGETQLRRIELRPGADGDLTTPWDNELVYQPESGESGNEVVISKWLTPVRNGAGTLNSGIFSYADATRNLIVRARVGDPVGNEATYITGPGLQGAEINITVSPRN